MVRPFRIPETAIAGILLSAVAYLLFTFHDATVKWLVATIPVWQVLFARSAMVCLSCLLIGRRRLLARAIESPLKQAMVLRGLVILAGWLGYFTAAKTMPLAQLTTLYFASPIMVTLMSGPLLGEKARPLHWLAVLTGFAGVLLAADPSDIQVSPAAGLVLLAAFLWAVSTILMRRIARREPTLLQMFYQNLVLMVATGLVTGFVWTTPTWPEVLLLLAIGLIGGVGQFCLFEGARRAPAVVTATVEYTALVWAFAIGFLVWGDIPHLAVVAGAVLITVAGIVLVLAERRPKLSRGMVPTPRETR